MSLSYLFDPNLQVQDKSGKNNVNGFLKVFVNGTDDFAPTYKNFDGTYNNKIIRLDNNGRAVVIVDDTMTYRLEVYDRDGAMLWTQYPVKPSNTVINYGINNTYVMNADVRGTPDEIDVSSTTDPQTGFKAFFIKLSSTVKDFLDLVSNTLTSHGDAIGNLQTTVSSQGTEIGSLQNGKKDKQQPKSFNGSATKTVKKVTQNENGEVTVEYEDIDLPKEVPNVDIVSPNNTITVSSSTNPQTNTKTFEIDVANGRNSCGWFDSSNIDTVGNEESINVDRFRISEGQSVIGNGLEFVPTEGDVESGVTFGKVYANAGIYFVSARLNVSWSGTPVNKVCNVAGRQFDFSYNHEERIVTTNLVRFSSRTKMSVSISLESDIPAGLRIWVDRFQIFAINAGTLEIQGIESVEHDGTLTGDGTNESPLSIQSALDVSNANTAPEYDPTATYPIVGTLRYHGNVLYKSTVAINTAEEWTEAHWEVDSVSAELDGLKADPEWEDITSKVGNYDGASITSQSHYITIKYNKKLAMICINGYVTPTSSGKVKIFSFNRDIVPFVGLDIFGRNGNNLILVTLRASVTTSESFYSYAITARDVVSGNNVEIAPTVIPLRISTAMFDEYLATH